MLFWYRYRFGGSTIIVVFFDKQIAMKGVSLKVYKCICLQKYRKNKEIKNFYGSFYRLVINNNLYSYLGYTIASPTFFLDSG